MSEAVSTTAVNGDGLRQAGGRFAPGNRFSVGVRAGKGARTYHRRWLEVLREEVDEESWRRIVRRAVAEAQGLVDDVDPKSAREFLAKFMIPPSVIERDQDDAGLLLS
jgi:hypothetical protein